MPRININQAADDPFYRYKMHLVETAVEGKNTLIKNLEEIGKELRRDPCRILKYLGTSFGCNTKVAKDEAAGKSAGNVQKYYLTGIFDEKKIQSEIFSFIDTFVLCESCKNPETKFIEQNGVLSRTCASCGAIFTQSAHKMNSLFQKDIGNDKYEDKSYNKDAVTTGDDKSIEFEDKNAVYNSLFSGLTYKSIRSHADLLATKEVEDILLNIENMLEQEEREVEIKKFLKELLKMNFSIDKIDEYFRKPKSDKKRNDLIKKTAKRYLDEYED